MLGVGPRTPEPIVELATFSIQTGGAVGTTLATVAALGGRARYFGRLSDDEFGSIILRGLKEFGVDVSQVLIEPGKVSPASFILVDERTGRRLVRFTRGSTTPHRSGRAAAQPVRRRARAAGRRPHAEHRDRRRRERQGARHHRAARRAPPRRRMGELLDLSRHRHRQRALRRRVLALLGHEAQPPRADQDGAEDRRHHAGRRGRDRPRGRDARAPAGAAIEVYDTTGASEVFRGAFIYGTLQGWPLDRCLPFANAAAALNCRHLGGTGGIPALYEVTRAAGLSA